MKAIGRMIWRMALENILTLMEPCTKENGLMINSMGKGKNAGLMVQYMKASINMAKKMDMENSIGLIHLALKEIFKIIIFMELELISGQMAGNSVEIGI